MVKITFDQCSWEFCALLFSVSQFFLQVREICLYYSVKYIFKHSFSFYSSFIFCSFCKYFIWLFNRSLNTSIVFFESVLVPAFLIVSPLCPEISSDSEILLLHSFCYADFPLNFLGLLDVLLIFDKKLYNRCFEVLVFFFF